MKVLIISDIHSNPFGLSIVLDTEKDADRILCAGDITGYYPFPNHVIEIIKKNNILTIKGNHDQYLLDFKNKKETPSSLLPSLTLNAKFISRSNLAFLETLNYQLEFNLANNKILLVHANPWNPLEGRIYPDYPDFARFAKISADIIILGHTHYPFIKKVNGKTVINPGSCGQPRDFNLLSYAIWDTLKKSIEIKRINWPVNEFIKKSRSLGTPESYFTVFNRKLD